MSRHFSALERKVPVTHWATGTYHDSWGGTRTRDPGIMSSAPRPEQTTNQGAERTTEKHDNTRKSTVYGAMGGAIWPWSLPPPLWLRRCSCQGVVQCSHGAISGFLHAPQVTTPTYLTTNKRAAIPCSPRMRVAR